MGETHGNPLPRFGTSSPTMPLILNSEKSKAHCTCKSGRNLVIVRIPIPEYWYGTALDYFLKTNAYAVIAASDLVHCCTVLDSTSHDEYSISGTILLLQDTLTKECFKLVNRVCNTNCRKNWDFMHTVIDGWSEVLKSAFDVGRRQITIRRSLSYKR